MTKRKVMDTASQQDLVELLFLAIYQDGHLSVEEDSMLDRALSSLGWEMGERRGPSVGRAFSAVREANSSEEGKELFLVERAGRLKEAGHSAVALEWMGKVLASDGFAGNETKFLEHAERLLFD
ncbi:hypothetical protein [Haloferula sp.]|uniref:hypothetical protein n=1 Tax=Haloferula sp. TaxID=2497595 RepID=UPI00329C2C1D